MGEFDHVIKNINDKAQTPLSLAAVFILISTAKLVNSLLNPIIFYVLLIFCVYVELRFDL